MTNRAARRLAAAALFAFVAGQVPAFAVPGDNPPPPQPTQDSKDKKGSKSGSQKQKSSEQDFRDGYRRAHELILKGNYVDGIPALFALGHDDHPDVANYLGYAHRKIGLYAEAKFWYERALAADPLHVRTWSYYGMWHAEQGNVPLANEYLAKIRLICGNDTCKEFRDLRSVINGELTY
jgi:tetratricopeptide (TPR) repeat protein